MQLRDRFAMGIRGARGYEGERERGKQSPYEGGRGRLGSREGGGAEELAKEDQVNS